MASAVFVMSWVYWGLAIFVGRKIQGHYEKGNNKESWYTGTIQYFNKKLLEYYVKFADGSFDYIKFSDIDGIEIVLLDP